MDKLVKTISKSRSAASWDDETAALIEWFLRVPPPGAPFELYQGVRVVDPARWWDSIRTDIAVGPGRGRALYGVLLKDLRRLAELFGGPVTDKPEET